MRTRSYNLKAVALGLAMFAGISSLTAQTDSASKRMLPDYNSIVINSSMDVKLTQGTENSIRVEKGVIGKKLITDVKDNVLYLSGKSDEDVIITFIKLNKIELLSSSDVKSTNQITSDKLEVDLTGSASDIDLDVNVKDLSTTVQGAGDVKYKGTADNHSIVVKGAGDVNAYGLETNSTKVEIDGAGDAKLNVKQSLTGTINGAGDVKYLSEPAIKDIKVNGVGSYGMKGSGKIAEGGSDTTRFKLGDSKVLIIKDKNDSTKRKAKQNKFNVYWAGVGIGVNGYLNANNQTKVPAGYDFLNLKYSRSINVSLNLWETKIPLWKKHINIVTGLGWDISNYRFSSNYKLIPDSNYISGVKDTTVTFKKNKLVTSYLNVPLLLQFDTNPFGKLRSTVHLSAGLVGSFRLGSHTKQVYEIDGVEYKPKTRDSFDLNTWRYSAMVRIGVGKLDLYASYALNGLFKKGEGPQLYPFTVGITLVSF